MTAIKSHTLRSAADSRVDLVVRGYGGGGAARRIAPSSEPQHPPRADLRRVRV